MTLIRLAVTCPRCGRSPNLRIFRAALGAYRDSPPDEPVGTIQCIGCREVYVVTARAYQEAA